MRRLIEVVLKFRLLVVALAVGLVAIGATQLRDLSVDVHPEFSPTQVEVQTEALGLSAEEVEQLITVPLEQDLLVGVPFLEEIESASLPGLSSVVMTFEPGTPLLDARQVVQERLTQAVGIAGLPAVAKLPQMIQPVSANRRVSMIELSSESLSQMDVSVLARWVIGPRLMSVPGVANVSVWGFRDRQLQVLVDPEELQRNRTTLSQVISTAGNALEVSPLSFLEASSPGTGGFIDTVNQRLNIFHEQTITTAEELAQVPLEPAGEGAAPAPAGRTLGDVAKVVESSQPLIGDAVCPGGEKCLFLVIEKFPNANTLEVTNGVDSALAAMKPGLGDVAFDTSLYRPATFIESSLQNLGWALLLGGGLLLLVLGLLLWDWRRLVISAVAIATSLGAAVTVLYLTDTTVNFMVTAGLVLGLTAVVYDSVVDPDRLARRLRTGRGSVDGTGATPDQRATVATTTADTRRTLLFATLVAASATIPLFFVQREGEAFFPPLMLSYLLAIGVSMVVALTITPVLGLMLLGRGSTKSPAAPWLRRLSGGYERRAPRLVGRTGLALVTAGLLAVAGLAALPFLDVSLRPTLKERDVLVQLEAPPGTSLPKMSELARQAVDDLGEIPGVTNVGAQVGRAVTSDQIVNVNSGQVWVKVGPDADYDGTVAAIERTVGSLQGVSTDVLTYSEERVTDILGQSEDDVTVRVYGENEQVLSDKADEIQRAVAGIDGVTKATVERPLDEPTVTVKVDLARAQAAGVKPGDVRRAAATLLGGMTVGNLFEQQKVFDVVVWGAPEIRQSEQQIENLLVDTPDGGHVRIGEVATVAVEPNPTVIRHESVATYLDVSASVSGRSIEAVLDEVDDRVHKVTFPLEHHAELLGDHNTFTSEQTPLIWVSVAVLIGIFLLLQAALRSWSLASVALGTLPLALAGGAVAAWVTGGTLTIGSIAGLVAIVGIATRAALVLLHGYEELHRSEGVPFGPGLVVRGTREHLSSTLVALLGTAALFAPLAVAGDAAGLEIVQPMAVVVLGGIVATALVNLLVVPALYLALGRTPDGSRWTDDLSEPVVPARRDEPVTEGVMRRVRPALLAAPLALGLAGCGGAITDSYEIKHEPASVQTVAGSDHPRVVLEAQAAKRLSVDTTTVVRRGDHLVVPTSATFVDPEGHWWVYTSPEPLVFERHGITVATEADGMAYLSEGPPAGTKVVTTGVPEIYGVEDAVGH
ncbi:efflux RND transporter permease subunit [Knoellia sp. p5-6-4]|uniref:efflux RND transporter permease subunit n=1 Tax=unclassified Knoellia TaxID=2618719 RepID=UPI0023DA41EC|nr:efflux RND transporter permease subunit [Knoellia sp. p5-6-4]MDF2146230.1 efflux RND transporter permease subunit [Knoellia sp. p5-6-4]